MIAVRTNLCSELLERERAKLPARRAVRAGVLVILLALGVWWGLRIHVEHLRSEQVAVTARQAALTRDLAEARKRDADRKEQALRRSTILDFADKRSNWAPLLEKIFAAIPPNVEISSLRIDSASQKNCSIQITGISAGEQPRLESDKCRILIADTLARAGYLVDADFIKLGELDKTIRYADADHPAAEFVIRLTWAKTPNER